MSTFGMVPTVAAIDAALHVLPASHWNGANTMNTPNETDLAALAALRAEIDVLRLMLAQVIAAKITTDYAMGNNRDSELPHGWDLWCGPEMAATVVSLAGPNDSPELHLEAFSRLCDSVRSRDKPFCADEAKLDPVAIDARRRSAPGQVALGD
jgi:hypothetical protein